MQKWEYIEAVAHYFVDGTLNYISQKGSTVLFENELPDRHVHLNKLGHEGWELVTAYPAEGWTEVYHFKRPTE